MKRKSDTKATGEPPKDKKTKLQKAPKPSTFEKTTKPTSNSKKKPQQILGEKPEDWNVFKKEKKDLRLKRRQNKSGFEVIKQAKQIGEKLRCRVLKGGPIERNKLINELHSILKDKGHYAKFVLAHDTSRIVQWLLKYSSDMVKQQISNELVPTTMTMLHSKYGIFCLKRLLKYGSSETKGQIIDLFKGSAVKLTSHSICAPVFEYAYTTWATNTQKTHLTQEFFGEMYKKSKDDSIKHLKDVYKDSQELKAATLGATKANLMKSINKNLLDSALVQTVLNQFLSECNAEDRAELIQLLVPHIVVISNSKDGVRVAMEIIWHGTNKDRKLAMKTLKEHCVELAKHEHGHCVIITLLDSADDTVLLHKVIIGELLKSAKDLAESEWGRKVLLWLITPGDSNHFHPLFVKELMQGRDKSTSKKDSATRQSEILEYSIDALLDFVSADPRFWLKNSSMAYELQAIMKGSKGRESGNKAIGALVEVIVDPEWRSGIEDPGIHMALKKIVKNDSESVFCKALVDSLGDDVLVHWLPVNRGCFLLIALLENSNEDTVNALKDKLRKNSKLLKKHESTGSKILLKKIKD